MMSSRVRRAIVVAAALLLLMAAPAAAIVPTTPIPVAFDLQKWIFSGLPEDSLVDIEADGTPDIEIQHDTILAKNGAQIQLLRTDRPDLDSVQSVPRSGYTDAEALYLQQVYVARLSSGQFGKFVFLASSPATLAFASGPQASSVLAADGRDSQVALSWDPLPDAEMGYEVWRYDLSAGDPSLLVNDFALPGTAYIDETVLYHTYLYVVKAIKADLSYGSSTTVAKVAVTSHRRRAIVVESDTGNATVDSSPLWLEAQPVIKQGRLMVPATLFEAAGVKISYDAGKGQVAMLRSSAGESGYSVLMTVGEQEFLVGTEKRRANVAPYLDGNVLMVPLRDTSLALQFSTQFNSANRSATVMWTE